MSQEGLIMVMMTLVWVDVCHLHCTTLILSISGHTQQISFLVVALSTMGLNWDNILPFTTSKNFVFSWLKEMFSH